MFQHLNPKKLEAFVIAHKQKVKEMDALVHAWIGNYGISALSTVISGCLSKNSKAKYIDKPIMDENNVKNNANMTELTEEEKRRKTEQLFMQLQIMGANFKNNQN